MKKKTLTSKKKLVNNEKSILNNTGNEFKKTLYYILLYSHFSLVLFLFFGWLSNSKIILERLLIILTLSIILFLLCKGCIITKLEYYLSKSNFTVIDPLFTKLGIHLSRTNRSSFTLILFVISFIITIHKLSTKTFGSSFM